MGDQALLTKYILFAVLFFGFTGFVFYALIIQKRVNQALERKVAERTAQLEHAYQEIVEFGYSISHDLRSPLRAIDGFSKFIQDDYADKIDSEGKRFITVIRLNAQKMDALITDLLDVLRMASAEVHYARIDMNMLVDQILEDAVSSEIRNRFELVRVVMPDAWGDISLIRKVWAHLIENAFKFTMRSGVKKIEIGGHAAGHENIYYVKDSGIGFNPEYANTNFGVFKRLHKEEDFEGNGVGLAIVQRIVLHHKGRVWAIGKENEGATFHFSIPVITRKS